VIQERARRGADQGIRFAGIALEKQLQTNGIPVGCWSLTVLNPEQKRAMRVSVCPALLQRISGRREAKGCALDKFRSSGREQSFYAVCKVRTSTTVEIVKGRRKKKAFKKPSTNKRKSFATD
jgi:hypothetical protein